jgi:hypothetical protein
MERFGADTRLLVKLLAAGQRLPVHAHPHVSFAAEHLGRAHGKAEAGTSSKVERSAIAQVGELGGYLCGRRLYETMLPWKTDPSWRDNELGAAFADVWCALPKVVFSRTLDSVQGNARLAEAADQHFQKGSHHDQIAAGRDSQPDQDHIAVAVGVLGTDIVLLTLGITGLASPDPELIRAGSLAMGHSGTPSCSRRR